MKKNSFRSPTFFWLWQHLNISTMVIVQVLLASLLINLFAIVGSIYVMNIYDRVVPNNAFETLWVFSFGVAIIYIFDFILRQLRANFLDSNARSSDRHIASTIFHKVMYLPMAHQDTQTGKLINHFTGFERFRDFMTSTTLTLCIDIPFAIIFIIVIAIIGGFLFILPAFFASLVLLAAILMQPFIRRDIEESFQAANDKQIFLIEQISALESIKLFNTYQFTQKKWSDIAKKQSQVSINLHHKVHFTQSFATSMLSFSFIAVVIMGVYSISNNLLSVGGLVACVMLSSRALAPFVQLANLMTQYSQAKKALQSMLSILKAGTEPDHKTNALSAAHFTGAVQFSEINFQYPKNKLIILNKINLTIKAQERIAIIGRVGSGKTTLLKLLTGIYEPDAGNIFFDDKESHQYFFPDLRKHMGIVNQDFTLFQGSLLENVTLGRPVSQPILEEALKISGVDHFTKHHPDGLNYQMQPQGRGLSGGQRQAIAIARALVNEPKMLLLDEPTSFMDDSTERQVRQELENYTKDKTLLLITHKMSMLSLVERIIILEKGAIIADGPKSEILKALAENRITIKA